MWCCWIFLDPNPGPQVFRLGSDTSLSGLDENGLSVQMGVGFRSNVRRGQARNTANLAEKFLDVRGSNP